MCVGTKFTRSILDDIIGIMQVVLVMFIYGTCSSAWEIHTSLLLVSSVQSSHDFGFLHLSHIMRVVLSFLAPELADSQLWQLVLSSVGDAS